MARGTWLAMLAIALSAPMLRAQSRPVFEVASVKAATQRQGLRLDSGRYSDTADLSKLKPATSRELTEAVDGTSVEHHGMSAFEPVLAPDGSRTGRRRIAFQGTSMEQAADVLASYMDRPVMDRTGLKGDYDFKIEYAVDQDASDRSGGMMRSLLSGLSCSELTAGLENSGLRCEATKALVEVLVVDGVERPTEN